MKHLIAGIALAALAGCTSSGLTPTSTVPTSNLLGAASSAEPVLTVAAGYISYCAPKIQPKGCDNTLIRHDIEPAAKALQDARNNVIAYVKANPGAVDGPAALLLSLQTATAALQSIETQNNLAGVTK